MDNSIDDNFRFLKILCLVLIATAAGAVYLNTLGSSFHFDDFFNIVKNDKIRELGNIPLFFTDISGPGSNRPLTLATLALNYSMGDLNTLGYHIFNTALHMLNSCLLFILISTLQRLHAPASKRDIFVPLAAALIFAVHPIQTEAVTYIISRSMLLCTAFGFAAFLVYMQAARRPDKQAFFAVVLAAISLAGVASREDFVAVPLLIAVYDYAFVSGGDRKGMGKRDLLMLGLFLPFLYLFYVLISTDVFNTSAGFGVTRHTAMEYLATQVHVHATYLRLLALPVGQNLDYDYAVVRGMPSLLPLVLYAGLWAGGAWLGLRKRTLAGFGLLWFMAALAPSSSIVPLVDLIFEHRLYMASAGMFALFATGLSWVASRAHLPKIALYVLTAALVLTLSLMTVKRNRVWADEVTLWSDVTLKSPQKARGFNELGIRYLNNDEYPRAEDMFRTALEIEPEYDLAHLNLSLTLAMRGKPAEAADECIAAMRIEPEFIIKCRVISRLIEMVSGNRQEAARLLSEIETLEGELQKLDSVPEQPAP